MEFAKGKKKKNKIGILGILLVSLLAISITLAYLQSHTEKAINTFTLGEGVKVELEQVEVEKVFAPGVSYERKAIVKIPDTAMSREFIAVKIYFYQDEMNEAGNLITTPVEDVEQFSSAKVTISSYSEVEATYDGDGGNIGIEKGTRKGWHAIYEKGSNCITCYYGVQESGGDITFTPVSTGAAVTVFDFVKVQNTYDDKYEKASENPELVNQKGVSQGAISSISVGQMKNFRIVVNAYAVQGDISNEQAMGEFQYLFNKSGNN